MLPRFVRAHGLGILGLGLLVTGSILGLVYAPAERYMGEVGRILYIHVPTAWNALLVLTFAFAFAVASLTTRKPRYDDLLVGAIEVGIVLSAMLLIQGSIWARPTWGVYWTWDPRLTTSAVMLVSFVGVLGLRSAVDDAGRRASWTAVATIIAWADVPIVYFSIKWWRTLHQNFSSPQTVASTMVLPLRINAFALLLLSLWLILRRARLSAHQRARAGMDTPPPEPSTLVAGDA
ncbi:MAG: cytochrome c biogenesis protein CcsA [Deltaproteobacteria bacterium]|nr:cytochrome c biogenesis protein CcsA [Deltaproteobacteria bacterium]MCB9785459.1 cytochrome c biogenesis protein CcsA [Deltaproteobacteria bacterium]